MTLVLLVFQVIFEELSIAWILDWVQSFDAQCIGIDTGYASIFAVRFDHLYFIAPAPVLRLQHEVKARKMRERQTISHLSSSLKSLKSSYPTWNTLVPSSVQSIGSKKGDRLALAGPQKGAPWNSLNRVDDMGLTSVTTGKFTHH